MIRVTLEFATVEETILALGKMSALGKARRAANASAPQLPGAGADETAAPPSAAVPPAPPAGRKPRSDAGRPRGSYKKGAGDGKADANTANPAPSAPLSTAAPETESPAHAVGKDHAPVAAGPNANAVVEAGTSSAVGSGTAAGAAEVAGPGKAAEEAANPESTRSAAPVAPSAAEAQAALEALFNKKGIEAARKTLGAFGVQRLKDLKEADRAAFIKAAKEALE